MFGFRKTLEVHTVAQSKFSYERPDFSNSEELSEYQSKCAVLEYESPLLEGEKLRAQLAEIDVPVYNANEVWLHMHRKADAVSKFFVFKPMREKDRKHRCLPLLDGISKKEKITIDGQFLDKVYSKAVPGFVLDTALKISEKIPEARFFITDLEGEKDPFLAVGVDGAKILVVDFWDEPSFKPTRYET